MEAQRGRCTGGGGYTRRGGVHTGVYKGEVYIGGVQMGGVQRGRCTEREVY